MLDHTENKSDQVFLEKVLDPSKKLFLLALFIDFLAPQTVHASLELLAKQKTF